MNETALLNALGLSLGTNEWWFRIGWYASEAQTRLGLRFVFFPDPSSSGDEVFGERQCCDLSPPRHSVIWV